MPGESNRSDESDIGGIYITILEKHFSAQVYWRQSVNSHCIYRNLATSAKPFSVAKRAVDSVANTTVILARRSETILIRRT